LETEDFTNVIYYKKEPLAKEFFQWARECGLKLVRKL